MIIDFNHAKKVATGCLAMTSCAFFLWVNQGNIQADTTTETATTQVSQPTTNSSDQAANASGQTNQSTASTSTTADQANTNINLNDHGNHAWLDSAKVNGDGSLTVSGWHATNASQGRDYHYLILYDTTHNSEIARQNITDQAVTRTDVAATYPVYGAITSGFNASFDLHDKIANLDQVQIISRYTNDAAGNGDAVDYWFAPITIDRQNRAYLDSVTVDNNQLVVSGWHATNLAAGKGHHWIILFDRMTNREVCRQESAFLARTDVAKAFPDVYNAAKSGFNVKLPMTNVNLSHQLQVISRYSASADGNSNYVDYWFNPITSGETLNQGYLDSINLSDGQHLTFTGWHATNLAQFENNRFAILYDLTANHQAGVVSTKQVSRPDVAKAVSNISGAGQSGFSGSFDLGQVKLQPGHRYAIVSRYSTSSTGNGGSGQYTDFWSAPFTLNQHASYVDNVQMTADGLKVSGWMTSDSAVTKTHPYLIVMNDGKEVARTKLDLTSRPDVGRAFGQVYNSVNSGFSTVVKFSNDELNQLTGKMQLIMRFTDDPAGNGNYDDQYSQTYDTNAGYFDSIKVNGNNIYVSGWHVSDQAVNKPYQYLIFVDQNGHELYRQEVLDKNRTRADVAKVYPSIYNSKQSGYQLGFQMPSQMKNKLFKVIHRFTDDKAGNGNYADYTSGLVSTSLMRTPIDYRQPSEYAAYPNLSQLSNFWIHVRIGQNRVYLMNNNDVVYTMYCTAGRYVNGVSLTPTGTYYVQNERGDAFDYGAHWTSWNGHGVYLFHSVIFDGPWRIGHYDEAQAKLLGVSTGSHGCIRLSIPDAYWIQHNVPAGTKVVIEN